jgi:hypothetical protein
VRVADVELLHAGLDRDLRWRTADSVRRRGRDGHDSRVRLAPAIHPAALGEIDEYHRWAAPLDEAIGRIVARDLAALLGTPNVASGSVGNFVPAYRVTIDVQRFQSTLGTSALVDALWTVSKTSGGPPRSGRSIAQEAVSGSDYDALAAAHSRALAKLSADIASAIRAEASGG